MFGFLLLLKIQIVEFASCIVGCRQRIITALVLVLVLLVVFQDSGLFICGVFFPFGPSGF